MNYAGGTCGANIEFGFSSAQARITRIQQELDSGEKILWTGTPDAGRSMKQGFAIWLFAIPWTVFSVFWESSVFALTSHREDPTKWVMLLFGTPFIVVGLIMLAAPFFARIKARNSLYVITDRRVLIAEFGKMLVFRSYLPSDIGRISRSDLGNNKSDLSFLRHIDSEGSVSYDGFTGISDARTAEALIYQLKGKSQIEEEGSRSSWLNLYCKKL